MNNLSQMMDTTLTKVECQEKIDSKPNDLFAITARNHTTTQGSSVSAVSDADSTSSFLASPH